MSKLNTTSISINWTEYVDKKYNSILIIDDFTSYLKVQSHLVQFNNLIQNRRHYRLSIFLLVQVYNSIPMPIRKSINTIFLFKCNKKEFQSIFDELMTLPKELVIEIMNFVFDKKYSFLYLDVTNQVYYKNLDHIIIPPDDHEITQSNWCTSHNLLCTQPHSCYWYRMGMSLS